MSTMRYLLLIFSNGGTAVTKILREETNSATLEVIVPYTGTNPQNKSYYTIGRTFWSSTTSSDYCTRLVITRQSHPEYFI